MAGAKFIELMRNQAMNVLPGGVELGKVTSIYPNLSVRINNMDVSLNKSFLVVPDRLNSEAALLVGDTVSLIPISGGQKYLILDKVVVLGG